jgi:hypothetical protein
MHKTSPNRRVDADRVRYYWYASFSRMSRPGTAIILRLNIYCKLGGREFGEPALCGVSREPPAVGTLSDSTSPRWAEEWAFRKPANSADCNWASLVDLDGMQRLCTFGSRHTGRKKEGIFDGGRCA